MMLIYIMSSSKNRHHFSEIVFRYQYVLIVLFLATAACMPGTEIVQKTLYHQKVIQYCFKSQMSVKIKCHLNDMKISCDMSMHHQE